MHLHGNRRILHKVCGSLCDALPLVFACIELVLDRCRSAARLAALSFDARDARMRAYDFLALFRELSLQDAVQLCIVFLSEVSSLAARQQR